MKGSGKQILLRILADLSTRVVADAELGEATRRLRAGLLLHGSTAEESFEKASRIVWASTRDDDGDLERQGMATKNGAVFISDLYETVFAAPGLEEHVLRRHPELTHEDYEAFEWVVWLLVSAVQMFSTLNVVETADDIDVDAWVEEMMMHYLDHFDGNTGESSSK